MWLIPAHLDFFEEGAIVYDENSIIAERGSPNSIDLPPVPKDWDKDKVTSIHLHTWQLDTEKNNYHMATSMGPCDINGFEKYPRNIIVGNIPGPIDGPKTISGIIKPIIGVAFYGRGTGLSEPSVVLSLQLIKNIINKEH